MWEYFRRRQWQPTPVLLPGKSHGRRSRVGCSPWGCKESDTTERLHFIHFILHHWRRTWQPTPVLLPGESHGWRSLADYSPRGCKELGTTELLHSGIRWGPTLLFFWGNDSCHKYFLNDSCLSCSKLSYI